MESGVYRAGLTSGEVLNTFLQGSETLWGMVDWEAGTCSFDMPLFGKLLEAAKRYGYNDRRALEPEITYRIDLHNLFRYNTLAEQEAFLLGEEAQYREELYVPPVHKESFDKWLEWELWWLSERHFEEGKQITPVYYGENTSEEKREAYKKAYEDARPLPIHTDRSHSRNHSGGGKGLL